MTRVYRTTGAIFLLFGAFVIYLSLDLSYRTAYGPGPGFFSFWLGVLLVALSASDIVGTSRKPREPLPEGFIPGREGVRRLFFIVGALGGALLLLNPVGFTLTVLLFSVFLLRTLGRQSWWATLVISVIGSFGTFYLFRQLQVSLPRGFWGM